MAVVELVWFCIVVTEYDGVVCIAGRAKDLCISFRNSVQVFAISFALKNIQVDVFYSIFFG